MMKVKQVAERLHVSVSTLNKWRCFGTGPAFVKFGSAVFYEPAELERWISECRRTSTWTAGNDNARSQEAA